MFKIFISCKTLSELYDSYGDKYYRDMDNGWLKIILQSNNVYVDADTEYWEDEEDDSLFELEQAYPKVNISVAKSSYFNDIVHGRHIERVIEEPWAVFILDIEPDEAEKIQNDYGVVCVSSKNLDTCILCEEGSKKEIIHGEIDRSWNDVLKKCKNIPSNTLIIIDRYLFGKEHTECYEVGKTPRRPIDSHLNDGLRNVKYIIKNVLPDSLSCEYHILIIFDGNEIEDGYPMSQIAENLDWFRKKELKKKYTVKIELLSLTSSCFNYPDTHNRRALSNYFVITAPQALKAFDENNMAYHDQTIRQENIFEEGITQKPDSDPAERSMRTTLKRLQTIYKLSQDIPPSLQKEGQKEIDVPLEYRYFLGNKNLSHHNLINRLIVSNSKSASVSQ